jgi:hypothetical protein
MQKKNNFTHIVFGNSIAALVASISLAKKKNNNILLINPKKFWGGHFNSINIGSEKFDIGMFLYEFDSLTIKNLSAKKYNNKNFQNTQYFSNNIKKFINQFFITKKISPIKIFYNKFFYEDYLISNNLSFLNKIKLNEKIKNDLNEINISLLKKKQIHPSYKRLSNNFLKNSLYEISLRNHGKTFHDNFIEPLCKKILFCSSKDIIAKFHRVAWLPLYWPETLKKQLSGQNNLKIFKFEYSPKNHATLITKKIVENVEKQKNITTNLSMQNISIKIKNKNFFVNNQKILNKNFIYGADFRDFLKIKKIKINENFSKSSMGLIFIITKRKNVKLKFSVVNFIEKKFFFYRITNQSSVNHKTKYLNLTIEFNKEYLNFCLQRDKVKFEKLLKENLKEVGIFYDIKNIKFTTKIFDNVYMHPNKKNYKTYKSNYDRISKFISKRNLIGPSSGFYKSSFNDQIIQGLKYGI